MGGSDSPENLVELTIEEHAEAHRILFEKYGKIEDYWAWKGLSGQIGKEDILLEISKENGKRLGKYMYENKLGIFSMSKDERLPYIKKGGKASGQKNAESGHCAEIAHLGGKAASGMTFWYNSKTNEETKSFESPGEDWIPGVKIERVNIEQLRSQADNTKGTFWIHNPDTNESKMVFSEEEIPDGFTLGRTFDRVNRLELLNVGENSDLDLKKIKSEFSDIYFDNSYVRWVFEFYTDGKKKITHIDYWTLVWARDCIINFYNLSIKKSSLNFVDSYSKEEVFKLLKSFRNYQMIERILLNPKLKKSKRDIYNRKLFLLKKDYDMVLVRRNKFL